MQDSSPTREPLPFKPHRLVFEQVSRQAIFELERPLHGLFVSGLLAGAGMGISILLVGILLTELPGDLPPLVGRILVANAFTVGFIAVIMAHTDLFTEYTSLAAFPVLRGHAPLKALARLWTVVYAANFVGATGAAVGIVVLGPAMELIDGTAFRALAHDMVDHPAWVILLSASLAGWLMGLVAWLVTTTNESLTQVIYVWLITGVIGFAHLHHIVSGTIEVLVGVLAREGVGVLDLLHFLGWTTLGNVLGGLLFAVTIRYAVRLEPRKEH